MSGGDALKIQLATEECAACGCSRNAHPDGFRGEWNCRGNTGEGCQEACQHFVFSGVAGEIVREQRPMGGTDWEAANLVAFIYRLLLELTADQIDEVCAESSGDYSQFTIPPGAHERIARNSVARLEAAWVRRLEDEREVASS